MTIPEHSRGKTPSGGFFNGMLLALSLFPVALRQLADGDMNHISTFLFAVLSSCFLFAGALLIPAGKRTGPYFAAAGILLCFVSLRGFLTESPFAMLGFLSAALPLLFALFAPERTRRNSSAGRMAEGAAFPLILLLLSLLPEGHPYPGALHGLLLAEALLVQFLFFLWTGRRVRNRRILPLCRTGIVMMIALLIYAYMIRETPAAALFSLVPVLVLLPWMEDGAFRENPWWDVVSSRPGMLLFTTFAGLCVTGALLLRLPFSGTAEIHPIDAAFTAVSAVCVTGLVVLDTARDFTASGQCFILLLIQLGGLGIMSIATTALFLAGRRVSLNSERLMSDLTGDGRDLKSALFLVFRYTFATEFAGGVVLSVLFLLRGSSTGNAVCEGFFTAVSAFCNAGFSLQSANMAAYAGNPLILHTVALLIVLGGIAPSTALMLPGWIARKRTPPGAKIVFVTTLILLGFGFLTMIVFEWNGVLRGLSFGDKLANAWFQSATLRTAGFNSVGLAGIAPQTFLAMTLLMFIGGSPGSTAGGIKTTTAAVLGLAFAGRIFNRPPVVGSRRIPVETVIDAMTIATAYFLVLSGVTVMLTVTQNLPLEKLIFETASALGTVGLSMDVTPKLDGAGKVIVMLTMFVGRVGPVTLLMLLGTESSASRSTLPDARIPLS